MKSTKYICQIYKQLLCDLEENWLVNIIVMNIWRILLSSILFVSICIYFNTMCENKGYTEELLLSNSLFSRIISFRSVKRVFCLVTKYIKRGTHKWIDCNKKCHKLKRSNILNTPNFITISCENQLQVTFIIFPQITIFVVFLQEPGQVIRYFSFFLLPKSLDKIQLFWKRLVPYPTY